MKAKDLAALAALGIAGKYAYDKFGNKVDEPAKKKMGEGLDMTNQGAMVRATRPEPDEVEVPRYVRDRVDRSADIEADTDYPAPRVAPREPVAVAKPVRTPVVTRSVAAAPAADAVADDYPMPRTAPKPVMPDASRVTPYNPDIMYNEMVPADTRPAMGSMNDQAYKRNQRAGVVPSQTPNDAAQARILRQGVRQVQSPNAQAQARLLRQGAGRAKGGAVKMASGGMASSKMSKPSGASRGDGIAQRGRTRGKYL